MTLILHLLTSVDANKEETANIWHHKIGINANIVNFVLNAKNPTICVRLRSVDPIDAA